MPSDTAKSGITEQDPESLLRSLDLELKQKRVQWKQAAARQRTSRTVTFVSLFLIIAAALLAFMFLFSQANTERPRSADPIARDR